MKLGIVVLVHFPTEEPFGAEKIFTATLSGLEDNTWESALMDWVRENFADETLVGKKFQIKSVSHSFIPEGQ